MANDLGMVFANRIERNSSPTTPTVDLSECAAPSEDPSCDGTDTAEDNYDGIDWNRLPNLQKPSQTSKRKASWIYKYGYRCQNRKNPDLIIWVCRYCHQHKITGRDVTNATSAAANHLKQRIRGHGYNKNGIQYPLPPNPLPRWMSLVLALKVGATTRAGFTANRAGWGIWSGILLRLPNLSIKFQSIQRIWPINQSIQSEGFKKSNQSSIACSDWLIDWLIDSKSDCLWQNQLYIWNALDQGYRSVYPELLDSLLGLDLCDLLTVKWLAKTCLLTYANKQASHEASFLPSKQVVEALLAWLLAW